MKHLLAATGVLALASPACAQSFLERMARDAAETAARNAGLGAVARMAGSHSGSHRSTGSRSGGASPDDAPPEVLVPRARSAGRSGSAASGDESTGPAPWPVNVSAPDVTRPGDLKFSPETEALADAFEAFGAVACASCEGGRSYDSWAAQSLNLSGQYGAWEARLGSLAPGEALEWTGVESRGRISVVSEQPIKGFPCKQLKWELSKGSQRAERPGLVCFGFSGPYAASETWNEVF